MLPSERPSTCSDPRVQVRRLAAAAALALLSATPVAADAAGELKWDWALRQYQTFGVVDGDAGRVPANAGMPPATLEGLLPVRRAGIGPLATTFDITHSGKVDLSARTIGAGVDVKAIENPWDPRTTPPLAGRRIGTASVEASIIDVVTPFSALAMLRALGTTNNITMDVRSSPLTGSMAAALYSDQGAGAAWASVNLEFQIFDVGGASPRMIYERKFSKRVDSTTQDTLFELLPGRSDVLGGRTFPLTNGGTFALSLRLVADASASGDANEDDAANPRRVFGSSKFDSTFTFGGFFDFRDEQGNLLDDVTFTSASGIDWLSPIAGGTTVVPVPGSFVLLAGALPVVLLLARRRRAGAPA